jgi:hypothetical protein
MAKAKIPGANYSYVNADARIAINTPQYLLLTFILSAQTHFIHENAVNIL